MNVAKGLGFVSSIAGAMLLLQVWNFKFEGTTLGNLLIVGSALCSAVNALVQKHVLNEGYHPLVVQSYVVCSGTFLHHFFLFNYYLPITLRCHVVHYWILAIWTLRTPCLGIGSSGMDVHRYRRHCCHWSPLVPWHHCSQAHKPHDHQCVSLFLHLPIRLELYCSSR